MSTRQPAAARPSWSDRLRYRFDTAMSRGTGTVILWLAAFTVGLVFVAAVVLTLFRVRINDDAAPTLLERFWQSLLRILDPGTFSGDSGWFLRVTFLLVTLLGVLIGGALIGLIVSGVDSRITELRKGRSRVVEHDHTLILGWSPRLFTMLSELIVANENRKGACVVVLSLLEKTEMEDEIRKRVPERGTTRIVCRTGDAAQPSDLEIVNVTGARSIVILDSGDDAGDAEAVRAVLSVLTRVSDLGDIPIVVELSDPETARALGQASGDRVVTVRADDVISRVTAQACRQPGLSLVCRELLDFDGDEIYFHPAPELEGRTFADALLAYEHSCIIGRQAADGAISVNPPMDTTFGPGDHVIAISEDDDTVVFSGFRDEAVPEGRSTGDASELPERILIIGWNALGPAILTELDQFVASGSRVDVLADTDLVDPKTVGASSLRRLTSTHHPTHHDLDDVVTIVREHSYDKLVILGYRSGIERAEADARSLLTLLVLQRAATSNGTRRRIVTELLDSRNVELARATGADDFVVSDELASLMLAQLSERAELEPVFADLFDSDGSALALHPVSSYTSSPTTFAAVVAAARAQGQVAIGYRDGTGAVRLNVAKSETVAAGVDDFVVVIAPVAG